MSMADVMSATKRSRLMKRVKQCDTVPELLVRRELHRLGLRFRLHLKSLPGSPDLVLPRHGVAIFAHGCFWHGHTCRAGRSPTTNATYWIQKLEANRARDRRKARELRSLGWRVLTIWECRLRSPEVFSRTMERVTRHIHMGR